MLLKLFEFFKDFWSFLSHLSFPVAAVEQKQATPLVSAACQPPTAVGQLPTGVFLATETVFAEKFYFSRKNPETGGSCQRLSNKNMKFHSNFHSKKQQQSAQQQSILLEGKSAPGEVPKQGRRSFVDVLNQPGQQFQFVLKGGVERGGCSVVKFKEFEWRKLAKKDELLLIGRFAQNRPPIDAIQSSF